MTWYYETNFELDLNTSTDLERWVEIRNPAGSGRSLQITRVGITSQAEFCVFRVVRYNTLATHGTDGDAPTQELSSKWDPSSRAPVVEIYSGEPGVALLWPSEGDIDYTHDFQLDPSDAGDDDKLQFNQYLDGNHTVVIPPGCSAAIAFPAGQAVFTVKILVRETPALPAAHITSTQLPAAGAYTAVTYFEFPAEWESVTFLASYTAHASSTNARPKWRVSWYDGTNDRVQGVIDTTLDVSAAPIGRRNIYQQEDRWPSGITANTTVHLPPIALDIPSGLRKVRLDVAELGDTTNRGTVTVQITGG